jgi:excisionase family DNA binding protein
MARVPGRRLDPRRAKAHYNYTIAEAADLFGVHRNTVRHWIGNGLETVKVGGLILILGDELRRYLCIRRAKRRVRCPPGSMYCMRCRDARKPPGGLTELVPLRGSTVDLRGICPDCGSLMHRRANLKQLSEIGFGHLTPDETSSAPNR